MPSSDSPLAAVMALGFAMLPAVLTAGIHPDPAAGQEGRKGPAPATAFAVPRLDGPIDLDGRVDEPAWEAIEPLPHAMHAPTFRGEPTERTEFRVTYDDSYIYLSCRAYDSEPAAIRAPSLERDDGGFGNDWCVINLDTFDDNETSLTMGTSPAGIRTDVVFGGDATAAPNFSWNTFWDAATSRDDDGWYAEIRVPLSSLRFQREPGTDRVVMGLAVWRLIARKNEIHTWPAISPEWGTFSFFKASQFHDAAFRGIEASTPLYVTPYVLGGAGRTHDLNPAGTGYQPITETVGDVGLDVKYGLASNLTLDLTVNTDFAQVEADDQQVNLTRFSLFFPEKRQFFQERGEIFDFSLGGFNRIFHSRRIGIVDGQQVPIFGGARLVGRLGDWDLGILDMQTAGTDLAPSENMGVLRLRRRVLNANSYLGGILTSRIAAEGGARNVVYGADAILRLFGQDYLTVNIARSHDEPPDPVDSPDPGAGGAHTPAPSLLEQALLRVAWDRRGADGLGYGLEWVRAGADFHPDLGFLLRREYTSASGSLGYGWRPGEASPILTHGPTLTASVFTRNADGVVETVQLEPRWAIALKSGHSLTASVEATRELLDRGFGLPDDAEVPAGEYTFAAARLRYSPPPGALIRSSFNLGAGSFYDGTLLSASIGPTWNVSRHLELNGSYGIDAIRLPDRDQGFTAHIARLRARVMVSTKLSTFAFLQYSSTADRLALNVRFRYNPSEGHDLYIVWNEGVLTRRHRLDPVPPLSERRTLLIKYSRPFTFEL